MYYFQPCAENYPELGGHSPQYPVQRTAYDAAFDFKQKIDKFPRPDPILKNAFDGILFVKDLVNLHVSMMLVFLEAIPSIRWHQLQPQTKQEVITYGSMEIPLIRSGGRALIGIPPARGAFEGLGLSKKLFQSMFDCVEKYIRIRPDSYEAALIAALAATSPDRGITSAVDYRILSNIQVRLFLLQCSVNFVDTGYNDIFLALGEC